MNKHNDKCIDLMNKLSIFGIVSKKGSVITIVNNISINKDELGQWRKSVHEFIGNNTDGSWRSERKSIRMIHSDICRHCKKKFGHYQSYDCKCYPDMGWPNLGCNCYYGYNSRKGYGWCEINDDTFTCRPFYIRLFNAVLVYQTNTNVCLKLPLFQKVRNEKNHLFKIAKLLLLANTFCTFDKHSEKNCIFAIYKLPRDILYKIILMSFNNDKNKKIQRQFNLKIKRVDNK